MSAPYPVGGYVLAGGKSSRMGRDKALLELRGKPLAAHAVTKLRRLCVDVAILSINPALALFAPLVADLYPDCGPLGGIHAALAHSAEDWCLILPVDVPFLPTAMLDDWLCETLAQADRDGTRLAMYVVGGKPHPTLLMIHRDLLSSLSASLARGEYKLLPALNCAAEELAAKRGLATEHVFRRLAVDSDTDEYKRGGEGGGESQPAARLYFANLNTPEDFVEAERYADALNL